MNGYCRFSILGHLGADPETRASQSGTPWTRLRIAVADQVKQGNEWVDRTRWFYCTAFSNNANFLGKYGRSGNLILVEGNLNPRSYEAKDGATRFSMDMLVDQVRVLTPSASQLGAGNFGSNRQGQQGQNQQQGQQGGQQVQNQGGQQGSQGSSQPRTDTPPVGEEIPAEAYADEIPGT